MTCRVIDIGVYFHGFTMLWRLVVSHVVFGCCSVCFAGQVVLDGIESLFFSRAFRTTLETTEKHTSLPRDVAAVRCVFHTLAIEATLGASRHLLCLLSCPHASWPPGLG